MAHGSFLVPLLLSHELNQTEVRALQLFDFLSWRARTTETRESVLLE